MADLPQLILSPLRDSYDLEFGDDVLTTQYDDGMPRQRLESTGRVHRTGIAFRHKKAQQDYLQAFWRTYRAKAFAMQLIGDSTDLEWYECRFVGKAKFKEIGYQVYEWSCEIAIKPQKLNIELDAVIIEIYNQTGGYTNQFFNILEKLVNQDLPQAMRGLNA